MRLQPLALVLEHGRLQWSEPKCGLGIAPGGILLLGTCIT